MLDASYNSIGGQLPTSWSKLIRLNQLDLSNNHLTGQWDPSACCLLHARHGFFIITAAAPFFPCF
jgi:hypothetical protein